jgi:signal transduction histidine kinase
MSITNSLTLKFTILVACILLMLSCSFFYFYNSFRNEEYDKQLEEKVIVISDILIKKDTVDDDLVQLMNLNSLNLLFQEKISIFNDKNQLIYTTNAMIPNKINDSILQYIRKVEKLVFKMEEREAVGILHKGKKQNYVITISAKDIHGFNELQNLLMSLLFANSIALIIVVVAGWIFARQALEPIAEIVRQVKHISPTKMEYRLNEGNKQDEIAKLAMTFNELLDKLHYAYEMKKTFVANASHELRTPLTNMLGTLETSYLYDNEVDNYKTSIASAIEEIKELIDLTNELLKLTKFDTENDLPAPPRPVRLDEIVMQIIGEAKRKYPEQKIAMEFTLPDDSDGMTVLGTPHLFKTALFNIIDNACKYANEKPVQVALWSENQGTIKFKVMDNGIGISEEEIRHIINPMYRGSNSQGILGFGIGLSLTKTILEKYNAKFYIDSVLDEGTKVTIIFQQLAKYTNLVN